MLHTFKLLFLFVLIGGFFVSCLDDYSSIDECSLDNNKDQVIFDFYKSYSDVMDDFYLQLESKTPSEIQNVRDLFDNIDETTSKNILRDSFGIQSSRIDDYLSKAQLMRAEFNTDSEMEQYVKDKWDYWLEHDCINLDFYQLSPSANVDGEIQVRVPCWKYAARAVIGGGLLTAAGAFSGNPFAIAGGIYMFADNVHSLATSDCT